MRPTDHNFPVSGLEMGALFSRCVGGPVPVRDTVPSKIDAFPRETPESELRPPYSHRGRHFPRSQSLVTPKTIQTAKSQTRHRKKSRQRRMPLPCPALPCPAFIRRGCTESCQYLLIAAGQGDPMDGDHMSFAI